MAAAGRGPPEGTSTVSPVSAAASAPLTLLDWHGPVALLTLNNPPVNVLTTPLLDELERRVVELAKDPRVRALVITGSGDRAFSGGASVREMVSMSRAEATRHSAKGQALYNLLEDAPFPVIAAVRGFCVGGGCEMVQACDFIIASEDASFGQPEINIGEIPGWGGSTRLPRRIGPVRARRWIMTGEKVGAAQALQDGFLDRVVPAADLLPTAIGLGTTLAGKPAEAIAAAKYLINRAVDPNRTAGLDYERTMWELLFETPGQREGMQAFLEKRPAVFAAERRSSGRKAPFPWERSTAPKRGARRRGSSRARARLARKR
ncbi:MAG TPA: enoyl-CoA hydratase/isomerase family protein [Thermoplasmata archaeon]|nr:enoyl-CoA hydratase/isomerase family protein [Thermoplasmata archaeon]